MPERPAEITVDWLRDQDACDEEVALFRATFGEGGPPTRADLLRAVDAGLDLWWLALTLLAEDACDDLRARTRAAADDRSAALVAAERARDAACAAPLAAYRGAAGRGGRVALGAYVDATRDAYAAYGAADAASWRAYMRAVAPALADILGLP